MLAEMGHDNFKLGTVNDSYEDVMLSDALLTPLEESLCESAHIVHRLRISNLLQSLTQFIITPLREIMWGTKYFLDSALKVWK